MNARGTLFQIWGAAALGAALLPLALCAAGDADGRLRASAPEPLPPGTAAVEVRPLDMRLPNRLVEAVLAEELRRRGFAIEIGAPVVVGYRATGVLSSMSDDSSWLSLHGSIGSSSAPTGSLSVRVPDFGGEDGAQARTYSIEIKAEDQPGTVFWQAFATLDSAASDRRRVVRGMVAAALDRLGRAYDGPLLR